MKSFKDHLLEAKKANTASTRQELSNRPRKELTGADADKKKKESDDAWERLMAHAEKKKANEETISEGNEHYDEAEKHLSKANDSEAKGDMKSFHAHMANHHDAMSEWHDSKGRSASADKHAEKADYHHEKSLTVKEEAEQIDELSSDLLQRYKDKAMKSAENLSSQGKYKKSTDRLMGHMKATGKQMAKTLKKEETARCEICGEAPCACDDSHGFVEGLKPEHKMRPGWMLKADPELAKKVAANKKKFKSFKDTVGKKIENK